MAERPDALRAVTYLAPNMAWFYQAVSEALADSLQHDMVFAAGAADPVSDPALRGDVDLAFICGLPLIRVARACPDDLDVLAAPVMMGERYADQPVYFTDVIVRADSGFRQLADLKGAAFSYNDLGSNSGYHLPRFHMMQAGYPSGFFGSLVESGSHQRSITKVLEGSADSAAIDSVVLEQALRDDPVLAERLRVVESFGPCPIPPVVVTTRYGAAFVDQARSVLLDPPERLQAAMQQAGVARYAAASMDDYAVVGAMFDAANRADYQLA